MAKFFPYIASGRIEDLILYQFRGKPCMRSMPSEVRQTEATKKTALVFGKAARIGKAIRKGMVYLVKDLEDKGIMNRLNSGLVKCLNAENGPDYSKLIGFSFTKTSDLAGRLKKNPQLSFNDQGTITLSFPLLRKGEQFIVPATTEAVDLRIAAVCLDPEDPDQSLQTWGICFDLKKGVLEPEQLEIPFTNTKGQLILVAAALRYFTDNQKDFPIKDVKWVPTGVVAVSSDNGIF